jgi:hypothetical protein
VYDVVGKGMSALVDMSCGSLQVLFCHRSSLGEMQLLNRRGVWHIMWVFMGIGSTYVVPCRRCRRMGKDVLWVFAIFISLCAILLPLYLGFAHHGYRLYINDLLQR